MMNFTLSPQHRDWLAYAGIGLFFILTIVFAFSYDGTVDSGDSIMHYIFSRYAFQNPSYFFHHWAKPVFVLLSSPFAQFGFTGIKLFNGLVSSLTLLFTYLTAKKMGKSSSWLIILFLAFAPMNFTIIFSGLTEPLSALFLILSIYLILKDKPIAAAIILSFLPFVRSEGLIFLGVFLVYFGIKKRFRVIPFLLTGHIVYAVAGYFIYHDLLWVVTKIPYAHIAGRYGSGPLLHYVHQLTYVVGIPIYILFGGGSIAMITALIYKPFRSLFPSFFTELWLVYGSFFAFFIAHTLFWYLGLFDSMGLKRVFITVMPLMALIGLNGFLGLRHLLSHTTSWVQYSLLTGLSLYILIFPFSGNPASIQWKKEFSLTPEQLLVNDAAVILKREFPHATYYHKIPYLGLVTGRGYREIEEIFNDQLPEDAVVIWDSWFATTEKKLSREAILADKRFIEINRFYNGSYELIILRYAHK